MGQAGSETEKLLASAIDRHKHGRLAEAESLYRAVLQRNPDQAQACNFLGMVLDETGKPQEGLALIERSIKLEPATAHFHNNLGQVHRRNGRIEEAIAAWKTA